MSTPTANASGSDSTGASDASDASAASGATGASIAAQGSTAMSSTMSSAMSTSAPSAPSAGSQTRQLATFTVDSLLFGIEVHRVQEVIRYQEMTSVPLAAHGAAGLINLRGEVVTAIDLRSRLGLPRRPDDVMPMNVVVRVDDEPVSLLVDTIGDVATVSAGQFEEPPETLTGPGRSLVLGAYKLQNQLLLALDVARAVDLGVAV